MLRKIPPLVWPAALLAYFTYLYGLSIVGIMGADEPRYAAISRQMAQSGNWITPRLWGQPWFEKPALLYWLQGIAFRLGLGPELAPRLPVALCAVAFLIFFWWILWREFSCVSAWMSTLILATMGGYLGYSQVGHMDLLLTATFGAAMLLALPWIAKGDTRYLPLSAVLLGLAVLAKSGVGLVLMLPLLWWGRRRLADLLPPARRSGLPGGGAALVPGLLLAQRHAVRSRTLRQTAIAAPHQRSPPTRPAGLVLPARPARPDAALDAPGPPAVPPLRLSRCAPGFPARAGRLGPGVLFHRAQQTSRIRVAAAARRGGLNGPALAEVKNPRPLLVCCAALLVTFPIAAAILPYAVESGISHVPWPHFQAVWLLPVAFGALAWFLDARQRRLAAVFTMAAGAGAGMILLKAQAGGRTGPSCVRPPDSGARFPRWPPRSAWAP